MQLLLRGLEELELKVKQAEAAESESNKPEPAKRSAAPRRVIPDHLEVEEIVLDPPEDQVVCGEHGPKVRIGEERTEEVDIIPPRFVKRVYICGIFACKGCEDKPVCAPAPQRAAGKGWAGPGLLAWM